MWLPIILKCKHSVLPIFIKTWRQHDDFTAKCLCQGLQVDFLHWQKLLDQLPHSQRYQQFIKASSNNILTSFFLLQSIHSITPCTKNICSFKILCFHTLYAVQVGLWIASAVSGKKLLMPSLQMIQHSATWTTKVHKNTVGLMMTAYCSQYLKFSL